MSAVWIFQRGFQESRHQGLHRRTGFVYAVIQPHRIYFTSAPKADNVKCLAINNKKKEQKQKILKLNLSVLLTLRPWVNVPPFFSLDPLDLCP